jgi:hypothetical protein
MMRCFCTYFDSAYLPQGLALYESLVRNAGAFELWVLCLDDETLRVLEDLDLPGIRPVALRQLETAFPALEAVKPGRSRIEYYFTCSPSWIRYVLEAQTEGSSVTYLDADIFFYSDPSSLYEELGERSVLIVPHEFAEERRDRERFGLYNVGFMAFRKDEHGIACLDRWREQCIEWCYDRVEEGRFADQKYLDEWPALVHPHLKVLENRGGLLAPWNWQNHDVTVVENRVLVDGEPLVFYHFHALKALGEHVYDVGSAAAGVSGTIRRYVYGPYVRALKQVKEKYFPAGAPGVRRYGDPRLGQSRILRYARAVAGRRLMILTSWRVF